MSRRNGILAFLLFAFLFLIVNRGAYKGYFQDDELDNISWTPHVSAAEFAKDLAAPVFLKYNFRPVGHFYFKTMEHWFGMTFPPYVFAVHLFHFLNVWLLWVLLRRLGASTFAAGCAAVFFGFHMALFEALWKPMYVFDVLCGTFSLACILFFIRRQWVLSFAAYWLAYKSKEVAVMLPAVLACYEYWMGKRQWKPLLPFFVASLSFGLQGIFLNPNTDNEYTFRFTPAALSKTSVYYAGRIFLVPFAGFALLAAPFVARDRRTWLGLATLGLLFFPMLFLPGRIFSAYCYVPFIGLAIAFSGFADLPRRVWVAAFFLAWLPLEYIHLRSQRRAKLATDDEIRAYVLPLGEFARAHPGTGAYIFNTAPAHFGRWGIEAVPRYFERHAIELAHVDEPETAALMKRPDLALLNWRPYPPKLFIVARDPNAQPPSFIRMGPETPAWLLESGWYPSDAPYRWSGPRATARLYRPPGARVFELTVNCGPEQMHILGAFEVTPVVAGRTLEPQRFARRGWQTVRWELPPGDAGETAVEFRVTPETHVPGDKRTFGMAAVSFGFPPQATP